MDKQLNIDLRYLLTFLVSILVVIFICANNYPIYSIGHFQRVDPQKIEAMRDSNLLIDGSKQTYSTITLKKNTPESVEYRFKKEAKISKITIDFIENKTINITLKAKIKNEWKEIKRQDSFSESSLITSFNQITATALQVSISSTKDSEVKISEIYIEEQLPPNIIERLQLKLSIPRGNLGYLLYPPAILLLVLSFGVSLYGSLLKKKAEDANLPIMVISGLFVLGIIGTIECLVPVTIRGVFTIITVLLSFFLLIKLKSINIKLETIIIGLISLIFVFQAGVFTYYKDQNYKKLMLKYDSQFNNTDMVHYPYGGYEMDYVLPFSAAKMMYYQIPSSSLLKPSLLSSYKLFDRTPLFSLLSIPFLVLFGDSFFVFQNISVALSGLFIISSFFLIKNVFNQKIAFLSCIVMILNPYLLFASHFFQIKILLVFFTSLIFNSALMEIKSKEKKALWLSSIGGFLIHPFAVIFIAVTAFYQFANYKENCIGRVIRLAKFYVPVAIAVLIWVLIGILTPGKNLFSTLSLSTNWRQATMESIESIPQTNQNSIKVSIQNRLNNLKGLVLKDPVKDVTRPFGPLRTTIPGLLSYTILFLAIASVFFVKTRQFRQTFIFSIFLLVLTVLYVGNFASWGLNEWLMGTIPLLVPLAVLLVDKLDKIFRYLFIFILSVEHFYITWVKFGQETIVNIPVNSISGIIIHGNQYIIFIPYLLVITIYILYYYIESSQKKSAFKISSN